MSESLSMSVAEPAGIMMGGITSDATPLSSSTTSDSLANADLRLRSAFTYYAGAIFFVATSFVLTFALQRFFPYPFLFFFFGAVVASAWFGGSKPGLLSVIISTLVVDYFFVPPYRSFSISSTAEAYFGAFVACALIASWVSSSKKKTEEELKETRDELERRVSDRTAALMKTQGELAHLSRMMSMAELTASIVHEIGQPLTGIVSNGQACLEWLSTDPLNADKARRSAEHVVRDGTRAGAVLDRIRALFKKGTPAKEWLNINEVVEELVTLLRDEARRRQTRIQTYLSHDLPRVEVDRVQIQQVILNLILNAMDAMNEPGSAEKKVFLISQQNARKDIVIRVEDCGVGLKPEISEKIFDPFFTTKAHGIGVGLSISRSIVESHNGRIRAFPRALGGTVLEFTIPVRQEGFDD
jgi:C4-dicarboxylate-specific signal transduction histidine kinase